MSWLRRLGAWYLRTFAWHSDLHEKLDRIEDIAVEILRRPDPPSPVFPVIPVPVDRTEEILARLRDLEDQIAALPTPVLPVPAPDRTDEILVALSRLQCQAAACRFIAPPVYVTGDIIPPNAALLRRSTRAGTRG